jgi:hypothetical protein
MPSFCLCGRDGHRRVDRQEGNMAGSTKDAGVIAALVTRFESQRLPRLLELKKKVDRGKVLNDADLAFLEEVQQDSSEVKRLADRNPEYQDLFARAVGLYAEIVETALKNEQGH